MGLTNPEVLSLLLNDLSRRLNDLNHRVSVVMDDAEGLKNVSADQVTQAVFDTHHMAYTIAADQSGIERWDREAAVMQGKIQALMIGITATERQLQGLLTACQLSVSYWNGQLGIAQDNLQQWKAYLSKALQEMSNARSRYARASGDYNRAQGSYNRCIHQPASQERPRDCSGYAAQMRAAQRAMDEALRDFRHWEQEKVRAEGEIRRWEARIAVCNDSLNKLSRAGDEANKGLETVAAAATSNTRSLEEIRSAISLLQQAKQHNQQQHQLLEQNLNTIQTCQQLLDQVISTFVTAAALAGQVQLYGSSAIEEIDRKEDILKEFSRIPNSL